MNTKITAEQLGQLLYHSQEQLSQRSLHNHAGEIYERGVIADGGEVFFIANQIAVIRVEVERFAQEAAGQ